MSSLKSRAVSVSHNPLNIQTYLNVTLYEKCCRPLTAAILGRIEQSSSLEEIGGIPGSESYDFPHNAWSLCARPQPYL
jgi:hypothetical protein